jgi:hypothetical protein
MAEVYSTLTRLPTPHRVTPGQALEFLESIDIRFRQVSHFSRSCSTVSSQRLKPKGAVWAEAHRIATVIWIILTRDVEYIEKGPAPPNQRTVMGKLRKLTRDFALLGIDFNKAVSLASA